MVIHFLQPPDIVARLMCTVYSVSRMQVVAHKCCAQTCHGLSQLGHNKLISCFLDRSQIRIDPVDQQKICIIINQNHSTQVEFQRFSDTFTPWNKLDIYIQLSLNGRSEQRTHTLQQTQLHARIDFPIYCTKQNFRLMDSLVSRQRTLRIERCNTIQ